MKEGERTQALKCILLLTRVLIKSLNKCSSDGEGDSQTVQTLFQSGHEEVWYEECNMNLI